VLALRGPEAARFAQGQLSADIEGLSVGASTLAGLHNAQGRVVALLAITRAAPEEFLAVLPRELLPAVAARLRKYVLRAKLRIEDASAQFTVLGAAADPAVPDCAQVAWGERRMLLVPAGHERGANAAAALVAWERADVAAGLPQVYSATSEAFIAQMLNLDLLDAIAFDKGCYTGQEVVARAHYRGRVKRRLQRWHNAGATVLKPGDAARTADGRSLTVVRAAPGDPAGQDVLAIGTFAAATEDAANAPAGNGAEVVVSGPLPLPYALPD
jgi:folate-binding protein YgfZ